MCNLLEISCFFSNNQAGNVCKIQQESLLYFLIHLLISLFTHLNCNNHKQTNLKSGNWIGCNGSALTYSGRHSIPQKTSYSSNVLNHTINITDRPNIYNIYSHTKQYVCYSILCFIADWLWSVVGLGWKQFRMYLETISRSALLQMPTSWVALPHYRLANNKRLCWYGQIRLKKPKRWSCYRFIHI